MSGAARRRPAPAFGRGRAALVLVLAALTLTAACGGDAEPGEPAPERRPEPAGPPNVVLIVMDTTRGDRCAFNGYDRPTTPRLDALAADGTTFRDCWSPSPWTGPSHGSLFTGLRPVHHGFTQDRMHLLREDTVLAEILLAAGYRTGCFSSNAYVSPAFGLIQGFEEFVPTYADPQRGYPSAVPNHAKALAWVRRVRSTGSPFFLFVNDLEPHAPYTPVPPHTAAFTEGAEEKDLALASLFETPATVGYCVGAVQVSPQVLAAASRLYDAEIATLDEQIGALIDGLRAAGALENTVIVVAGDHGENLGDHGLSEHIFSLHRSLLHVPLIVWGPGRVPAGRVIDDPVRLEDVFPTLLELCKLPLPADLDGRSLLGDTSGRVARATYARPTGALATAARTFPGADTARFDRSLRSVYDGRHHLIAGSDGTVELYDVDADPLERNDLSSARGSAAAIERLRALLDP